jgi:hypothetical protein
MWQVAGGHGYINHELAIADIVDSTHLKCDYLIPKVDDPRIIHVVTDTLKYTIKRNIDKKPYQQ